MRTLAMGGARCMGVIYNLVPRDMVVLYDTMISNDLEKQGISITDKCRSMALWKRNRI